MLEFGESGIFPASHVVALSNKELATIRTVGQHGTRNVPLTFAENSSLIAMAPNHHDDFNSSIWIDNNNRTAMVSC